MLIYSVGCLRADKDTGKIDSPLRIRFEFTARRTGTDDENRP